MAGKQGKTKGATSFVYVALAELNSVLRPEANVLVSRKYAETLNINYEQVSLSSNDLKRHRHQEADRHQGERDSIQRARLGRQNQ